MISFQHNQFALFGLPQRFSPEAVRADEAERGRTKDVGARTPQGNSGSA